MLSWKFDVTLSFSGADRRVAYELAHELARGGLTVFFDERFESENSDCDNDVQYPDTDLTAQLFIALVSKAYLASLERNPEFQSALVCHLSDDHGRVLPIFLNECGMHGDHATDSRLRYQTENVEDLAERIACRAKLAAGQAEASIGAATRESQERHVLASFVPAKPKKPVEITRYGIVQLMREHAKGPASEVRVKVAIEVAKCLFAEYDFHLGWPYDIWYRDGSIYLSALPDFSSPHQTLEFALDEDGTVARLKSVWTANDERYGKIDYHLWQPSVAKLTADRVVPCLEREVTIRLMQQAGTEFGFPLTSGERDPKRFCGWIEQLPPYDFMEWGRDPRLVSGRLGPPQYLLHNPTKIAVYTMPLVGRWSAAAFRTLSEALTINLPKRHRITVLGQGRVRLTIFLADINRQDLGRAFLVHRRALSAVARMYAALRELPVPPPDGSVALSPLDSGTASKFDLVCEDLRDGDQIAFTGTAAAGGDAEPFRRLSDTPEGQALGICGEPGLDLDSLVTHRDIVRFVQRHE